VDFAEITTQPIDIATVARRVVPPDCGVTVTLDGYPRRFTREKATGQIRETRYLIYEAYEPMAIREMRKIAEQAKKAFAISSVGIVHRIGRVEIGQTSVVISVAAPHRAEAFAACEWLIKELKRTVPIWKKEVYGTGEAWSEGETD
jgi:molybdopterin synthase catalytic subunit